MSKENPIVLVEISKDISVLVNDFSETLEIRSRVTGSRVIIDEQEARDLVKLLQAFIQD